MSCSCRATQLKTFVQDLVQVHRFEAVSLRGLARLASTAPRAVTHGRLFDTPRQQRSFHVSAGPRGEAAGAAAAVSTETTQRALRAASKSTRPSSSPETEKPFWEQDDAEEPQWTPRTRGQQTAHPDSKGIDTSSRRSKPNRGREPSNVAEGRHQDRATHGQRKPERWQIQKAALKEKFPEGWKPRKRLSPDALTGIRALNAQFPDVYTTEALANKFKVSPEAIRRILRSHWQPSPEQEEERRQRWFRRGMWVWERKAALGVKPPRRWRMEGIVRDPEYHERSRYASQREREWDEEETRKYRERRAAAQGGWRTGETP